MTEMAIETRGLTRRFGRLTAVDEIDLRVPAGSTVAVVGPTGSGKSTLVSLVPRLWNPPPGTLFVDGHDPILDQHLVGDYRLGIDVEVDHALVTERLEVSDELGLEVEPGVVAAGRNACHVGNLSAGDRGVGEYRPAFSPDVAPARRGHGR